MIRNVIFCMIGLALFGHGLCPPGVAATSSEASWIGTRYISANVSLDYPGFESLSLDSVGKGQFHPVTMIAPPKPWPTLIAARHGGRVEYSNPNTSPADPPCWTIDVNTNELLLESRWSAHDPPAPFVLDTDTTVSHLTLLGMLETNGSVDLPALMHFPDQGTFRISADTARAEPLGYATTRKEVRITFPPATGVNPKVTYHMEVVAIHPEVPGIETDERFDGFRRNWLNIFQINPQRRMLSNNAGSDTCGFCYYEYADIARNTPPLAAGLTALDLVRQTMDRIFAGTKVCGMPGYTRGREDRPESSADILPSFLIAAKDYAAGSDDKTWLKNHYDQLKSWADQMLATDRNHDGLIKYILSGNSGSWPERIQYRPANWWDTIGFGYEDAYANALAYRALRGMEKLAEQSNHPVDMAQYHARADKLKDAYFHTFYNPATGVLAGWRSADGQLHDYYFPWVSGIAIDYGLIPKDRANSIMDELLVKMKDVGYTNFSLGLPSNLIPVARKDYVHHNPRFGGGTNEDGSDAFQIYENGGATACFAYFTLAALYDLDRIQDGDQILFPLLRSFAQGDFQGFCANKMSKDWKTWSGDCHGYEGLLNDNYYALLAVLDRQRALKRATANSGKPPSEKR